MEEHICGVGDR